MSCPARLRPLHLLPWVCAAVVLAACSRAPQPLPGSQAEPAAAVERLAATLREDDLVGYAKTMVTPAQYAALEQAWREDRSRWPLSTLPLGDTVPSLLVTLSAEDAEATLMRDFDRQLAGQANGLRQAARALGLFGTQYLRTQGDYSPEQRTHYLQLVGALSDWAASAPLADRQRARASVHVLVQAVKTSGLRGEDDLRALGMEESLRRLGPVMKAFKTALDGYALSLDDTLAELRIGLVEQQPEQARVRVQYPLGKASIDVTTVLVKRDGHWYPRQAQQDVAALLAPPAGAPGTVDAPAAPAVDAPLAPAPAASANDVTAPGR